MITDAQFHDFVDIITALSALGAVIVSFLNFKKLGIVHIDIDGRMSQLLKATGDASHAEGEAKGRKDQQIETGGVS